MSQHMFPTRTAHRHSAFGEPGAENTTGKAIRNTKGSKQEFWSYSRGVAAPGGCLLVTPRPEYAFLGARAFSPELCSCSGIHRLLLGTLESKHTLTLCVGQVISEKSMEPQRTDTFSKSVKVAFG